MGMRSGDQVSRKEERRIDALVWSDFGISDAYLQICFMHTPALHSSEWWILFRPSRLLFKDKVPYLCGIVK